MQSVDHDLEIRRVEGDVPTVQREPWVPGPLVGLAVLVVFVAIVAIAT